MDYAFIWMSVLMIALWVAAFSMAAYVLAE